MSNAVEVRAHAKLNLFLRVFAREASGFHSIETLFTLVELADEIRIERTGSGIELEVEGADTGPAGQNLATRAARLVLDATGNRFGVRIRLVKHIPVRAGLGGGSSDAAATLHGVNALAGNAVPRHELLQFAARLGSDIPFLAAGIPLALAWGHGERLFRLPPVAAAPVLLAVPEFGMATADAYAALDTARTRDPERGAVVLDQAAFASWGNLARLGGNDFESVAFSREPGLKTLFERMAETRPLLVRMSGSGSALAAIYRAEPDRERAAATIGTRGQRLFRTTTRPEPPARPES